MRNGRVFAQHSLSIIRFMWLSICLPAGVVVVVVGIVVVEVDAKIAHQKSVSSVS